MQNKLFFLAVLGMFSLPGVVLAQDNSTKPTSMLAQALANTNKTATKALTPPLQGQLAILPAADNKGAVEEKPSEKSAPSDSATLVAAIKKIENTKALLAEQLSELELRKKIATVNSEIAAINLGGTIKTGPAMPTGAPTAQILGMPGGPLPQGMIDQNPFSPIEAVIPQKAVAKAASSSMPAITEVLGLDGKNKALAVLPSGEQTNLVLGSKYKNWEVIEVTSTGVTFSDGKKTQFVGIAR